MKKIMFSVLTFGSLIASSGMAYPYCRNDWDCSEGEMCVQGTCEKQPQSEPSQSSGSDGWQCRNDWDCSSGESCLSGICSSNSSDGGSQDPIYGG